MKRTNSASFAVVALLAFAGCKKTKVDPVKLVPDQASMIAGIDVNGLTTSKLYTENKDQLAQGEVAKALEAAKECKLGPKKFKTMYLGLEPSTEDLALVVNAEGVGKDENLKCVHDKIKAAEGQAPWTIEEKDGKKTLSMQGGELTGRIVSDDVLVVMTAGWTEAIEKLVSGKGKSAAENSLKQLYARAPKDKDIWFAGNLPDDVKASLAGSPGEKVTDMTGGLDFSGGLDVTLAAGVGEAGEAEKLQAELQKQFDQMKGMGVAMGVPQGVIDSVAIATDDSAVTVEAAISEADMAAIQERLGGLVQDGGMGGGGMAQPPGMPPAAGGGQLGAPAAPEGEAGQAGPGPEAPGEGAAAAEEGAVEAEQSAAAEQPAEAEPPAAE